MDENFVKLAQKIVKERGKNILSNKKLTKALFMDYSHGEYKNETRLLLKTIELGYPDRIHKADDVDTMKLILARQLNEDHFIIEKMAIQIVSLLIALIKDGNYIGKKEENNIKKHTEPLVEKPILTTSGKGQFQKREAPANYSLSKNIKITNFTKTDIGKWTCNICDQENSENLLTCKGCGAYKPSNAKIIFSDKNITKIINYANETIIRCFKCGKTFTANIEESEFIETNCKYCHRKITLKNVIFI
jgi:DNA-directed RNA polymerase subunit RPC12/RpoP